MTNLAFVLAAMCMWQRTSGLWWGRVLCIILALIGLGSYLFHTHATAWAITADVVPIGVFILTYLFLVNWHILGWPHWIAVIATLGFLPYGLGTTLILNDIPFFKVSNFYWSVPILLILYAGFLWRSRPSVARNFLIGAALLSLSITLRSLDGMLCAVWPLGTHFGWHILNAVMLAWMIEVYRRHMLEARPR